MTPQIPHNHPLRRFFCGAIEDVFYTQLGICAPDLVAYLSNLLTEFIHVRDIYPLRSAGGDLLRTVSDMVSKAHVDTEVTKERRQRLIHLHVGDYTLYWTGLFPEGLGSCKGPKDYFLDYCEQGKESYDIASDLSCDDDDPPAPLLKRLSTHFEDCAYGLTLARRAWHENS